MTEIGVFGQLFHRADRGVVLPPQLARAQHLDERIADLVLAPLHACSRRLRDEHVTETVDGESRQAIGFAEHEAVVRLRVEPPAQGQRDIDPMHDQRRIERMLEPA